MTTGTGTGQDREQAAFWLGIRQALLLAVDHIERMLGVSPSTAEIRQLYKAARRGGDGTDS